MMFFTVLDGTVSSSRCMEEPEMITMSGRAEVATREGGMVDGGLSRARCLGRSA